MQQPVFKISSTLLIVATAILAALWLANLTHNEFGISRHTIRADALLSALLVFGFLLIGLFSARLGKRSR